MKVLTEKTLAVLDFIIGFQDQHGYSPSISQIMSGTKSKSIRGISLQLEKLQVFGYIFRDKNSRRAITVLVKPGSSSAGQTQKIPLVGEIRAGVPSLAKENIEGYKEIPLSVLHGRKDAFLLRVKGESMLKAGFKPGDIVIVVPQPIPLNGDIVVAFNPDEETATLKRFKKMENFILLLPESDDPQYQPIIGRQFVIQGKVINKLPEDLI